MHQISSCTMDDWVQIEQILLATWLANNTQDAHESFVDEINKGDDYFLAKHWKQPLWIVSGKTEWRPRHGLYELYHIWVVPDARWTWLAKELFDTLVHHAKNLYKEQWYYLRKFYLKSGDQNIWAHNFYKKMGMIQTDSLTSHFAQWRRELIFHLLFDEEWSIISWD